MRRFGILFSLFTLMTASAHDIITTNLTYTRDISRVFARRCASCHSSKDSIPLTTYEEARPWAVAIKEQVLSRQMPPWGAVKGFGQLSGDRGLTQEEIMLIAGWVVGGAPNGNPAYLASEKQPGPPPVQAPVLKDVLVIDTKSKIKAPLVITGIRPITTSTIGSARITASFPDGHIEPLLWLFHYNPAWRQTFRFREPISLPAGAVVEAGASLEFALETGSSPSH